MASSTAWLAPKLAGTFSGEARVDVFQNARARGVERVDAAGSGSLLVGEVEAQEPGLPYLTPQP